MIARRLPPVGMLVVTAALLIGPWLIYAPALDGDFVFDDNSAIVDNPGTHDLTELDRTLRFWQQSDVNYRPVRYLTFMLDWKRGGGSPRAFHETNLVLHGLAAVALYALLLLVLPDRRLAPWAALLWLVHPLQTESVAYITGRKDLLCALFYFIALLGQVARLRARGRPGRVAGTTVFLTAGVLAFFSKEMSLTLPAVAFALDVMMRPAARIRDCVAAALRQGWIFYGLVAIAWTGGLYYKLVLAPGTTVPFNPLTAPVRNLPLAIRSLALYLRKAFWPWPLVADLYGVFPRVHGTAHGWATFWNSGSWAATAVGLALAAALLVAVRHRPRSRLVQVGLLLFVVTALPVSNLVPLNEPAAEHFAYLPLAPLTVALVAALAALVRWRGRAAKVAAVAGLVILAAASFHRAAVWRGPASLWASVIAVNDGNDRAWNELGLVRRDAGDLAGACDAFQRAIAVAPVPLPQAYANLMRTQQAAGDLDGAVQTAHEAAAAVPSSATVLSVAGGILLVAHQDEEARQMLDAVADLPDGATDVAATWARDRGIAHVRTGDETGGERILQAAAKEAPNDPSVLATLGWLYMQEGRLAAADSVLAHAVALPGASPFAWRNRAVILLRLGRAHEAQAAIEQAAAHGDQVPPGLREAIEAAVRAEDAAGKP